VRSIVTLAIAGRLGRSDEHEQQYRPSRDPEARCPVPTDNVGGATLYMGRIRTVKPELFKHGELFDAEVESGLPLRLAFIALFTCCDRSGRFKWRPRELKLDCLPHDAVDFSRVLDALTTRGFVVRYADQDGVEYGCIPSFERHQVINNREKPSELPNPTETGVVTRDPRVHDASTTRTQGKGREGKGKEGKEITATPSRASLRDKDWFKAECAKVVEANPNVLALSERKGFFDYWTEASASGKMRFEGERYFDFKRRMETWQRNADKRPAMAHAPAPSPSIKPWMQ
jgi:hypothetical protein